jgi:hypothetical protein
MGIFSMNDSEQERRMRMERFACRENIARFRHLLATDPNEQEHKMLIRLLAEEHEKRIYLGVTSPPAPATGSRF